MKTSLKYIFIKDIKKLFYISIFVLLTAFTWHKYYISVTEINIKQGKLEIIMRTFPDDMENILEDTYHTNIEIADKQFNKLLKHYLDSRFILYVNNKPVNYKLIGTTLEDNFLVILIQAEFAKEIQEIKVKNTILQDMFEEQKNIIHFINGNDKKSFVLEKANPVAVYVVGD